MADLSGISGLLDRIDAMCAGAGLRPGSTLVEQVVGLRAEDVRRLMRRYSTRQPTPAPGPRRRKFSAEEVLRMKRDIARLGSVAAVARERGRSYSWTYEAYRGAGIAIPDTRGQNKRRQRVAA